MSLMVDTGVQCDPPPPEQPSHSSPLGPWPQAPSAMAAAQAAMHAAYPYGFPYGGSPYGPPMGPPLPPSPYPFWGYGMPGLPVGPQACAPAMPQVPPQPPLMRQLFGAAMLGQGGGLLRGSFAPGPPREAWGPGPSEAGAAMAGMRPGGACGSGAGACGAAGGPCPEPPEAWALSVVDEGFRLQLEQLRQAAARNRAVLEKIGVRLDGNAGCGPLAAPGIGEPRPEPTGLGFSLS